MGTLPRTLVKWEIVSGYLWGHYIVIGLLDYLKMGAAGLAGMMPVVLFYESVPLVKDIPYIGKTR
jgi:hypothetical protein